VTANPRCPDQGLRTSEPAIGFGAPPLSDYKRNGDEAIAPICAWRRN
jgi:hypothetical protein